MRVQNKLLVDYYVGGLLHALLKLPTLLLGKILHRNHNLKSCSEITFLKMMGGGSIVIAYPTLLALKQAPQVRSLRLVTTHTVKPFAEVLGVFDEIIVIRDGKLTCLIFDSLAALVKLFRCQVIVDLEVHSRLTTVFSLLTCAINRVGFFTNISIWRRNLATHLLFFNSNNPVHLFYDQIARLFGTEPASFAKCIKEFRAHLRLTAPDRSLKRLALAPCCSDLAKTRMLTEEQWVEAIRRYADGSRGLEIDLVGGPADRAYLERLAGLIQESFQDSTVKNFAGILSLQQSVRAVANAGQLLCVDSAMIHFARLMGVPTLSFWGPTDPNLMLRPSNARDQIHYKRLDCSPCIHMADHPPCGGKNVCMQLALESMPNQRGAIASLINLEVSVRNAPFVLTSVSSLQRE